MTNNTYSTTYNPLGNVTITAGGYALSAGTSNTIYMGGGGGGQWSTNTTADTISPNQLQVKGDAEFLGNIRVKGRDLTDWLEQVDSRLAILQINPDLETEFDELRALGDAYREAERRFNEQKRVYEILKNTDE